MSSSNELWYTNVTKGLTLITIAAHLNTLHKWRISWFISGTSYDEHMSKTEKYEEKKRKEKRTYVDSKSSAGHIIDIIEGAGRTLR